MYNQFLYGTCIYHIVNRWLLNVFKEKIYFTFFYIQVLKTYTSSYGSSTHLEKFLKQAQTCVFFKILNLTDIAI